MGAVGYVRVSTDQQATEGVSVEAQKARIGAWAEARGLALLETFEDAISGKRADNRPGLQRAVSLACSTRSALVVYSLSRLARSVRDALDVSDRLDKAGADLVSLTESIDTTSPHGRFTFKLWAILAELERDITGERTRGALAHKKAQGERVGGVPFGADLDPDGVHLVPNPTELAALGEARRLRAAGWSYQSIAAELENRNLPTKKGLARWDRGTLAKVLKKGPKP